MIRLIAACTDRKSSKPIALARMLPVGKTSVRAAAWLDLLRSAQATVTAFDLYQGEHWAVARSLAGSADLWVASAGYGLVAARTPLVPYAATFSKGHLDSVMPNLPRPALSSERQAWWAALQRQASIHRPNLSELCQDVSATIVAATGAYVDAMSPELLEADRLGHCIVITSTSPVPSSVAHLRVPSSGRLRTVLGGSMQSLNIRLARHLLEHLDPTELTLRTASDEVRRLLNETPPLPQYDRIQTDDASIVRFIRNRRATDPRVSHTRLLREFRDSGRACEQGRFRRLYEQTDDRT